VTEEYTAQRNSIMKKVHGDMFVHRSAINQYKEPYQSMVKRALELTNFSKPPDVICINTYADPEYSYKVRFSWVDDFNNNPEPNIEKQETWVIRNTNAERIKTRSSKNGNPQIYHGKDLLVNKDYYGFDVEHVEKRREQYKKLNPDKRRMGYRNWWDNFLEEQYKE
jgi:hypothetical protein